MIVDSDKKDTAASRPELPLEIQVCRDFEQLTVSGTEWDTFVENTGGDLFLTYDWCRTWWKYYGGGARRLHIFIFWSQTEIVGILPLFFERLWLGPVYIDAVKIVGSDSTLVQFSLPFKKEFLSDIIRLLFKRLAELKWDILHLGQIAGLYEDYTLLECSLKQYSGDRFYCIPKRRGEQIYFHLPESRDSYLGTLKHDKKRDIDRVYRQLAAFFKETPGRLNLSEVSPTELVEGMDRLIHLHRKHWQSRGLPGHFDEWPNAAEFHKENLCRQAELSRGHLTICRWGDVDLAYEYYCVFAKKLFHIWNARLDTETTARLSIGTISNCELIKTAIDENIHCIDSMRGRFEHKLRLGGTLYPIRTFYICKKRLSTVIRGLMFRVSARLIHILYFKLWRKKICPKIRRYSPFWRVWIRTHMFS